MAADRKQIREWLQRAKKDDATHLVVVCDTFDYENYPVYVYRDEDVREVAARYDNKNMQRVAEVYNMAMDIEMQLAMDKVMYYEVPDMKKEAARPEHHPPTKEEINQIAGQIRKEVTTRHWLTALQNGEIDIDECIYHLNQIHQQHGTINTRDSSKG